ncbi:helix-turn-helix domain-containing protein [Frigidibacter sp. MR17.24]|uniref:helix-turn-helix domain-containing protein n=1 Tax=Frigidibacter sp. MR17.24 TaxID=3127345 RepID=UPI0030131967
MQPPIPDQIDPDASGLPRVTSAVVVSADPALVATLVDLFATTFGWWTSHAARLDEARALAGPGRLVAVELPTPAAAAAAALLPAELRLALDPAPEGAGLAAALSAGFDEAVRLPLCRAELEARLRRIPTIAGRGDPLLYRLAASRAGDAVELDPGTGTEPLRLTPNEADILRVLVREAGRTVTRDALSRQIDRCDWEYGDRKFDVHVTRIRRKLSLSFGDRYHVAAVRSEGYRLEG